jgi:hypothetical protein
MIHEGLVLRGLVIRDIDRLVPAEMSQDDGGPGNVVRHQSWL